MGQDKDKPSTRDDAQRTQYMDDPITSFNAGALTDWRMRAALQLLVQGTLVTEVMRQEIDLHRRMHETGAPPLVARTPAEVALWIAEDLVRLGEQRGYIQAIPDTADLSARTKKQAHRLGSFGVEQQVQAQRDAMLANAGRVATPN